MSTKEEKQLIERLDNALGYMKWAIGRASESRWFVSVQDPNPSKDWSATGATPMHAMRNAVERLRRAADVPGPPDPPRPPYRTEIG